MPQNDAHDGREWQNYGDWMLDDVQVRVMTQPDGPEDRDEDITVEGNTIVMRTISRGGQQQASIATRWIWKPGWDDE
jgi:hypothetical protein